MDFQTAVKGIVSVRKRIHEQDLWEQPGALSDAMLKLATYNAYLADDIAGLHKNASETQGLAFKSARDLELSATEADRISRTESIQERYLYENAQNVYKATANLITVIQSRLKVIEQELRNQGKD